MEYFDSTNGIVAPDYAVPVEQDFRVDENVAEDGTRWAELIDVNAVVVFNLTWSGLFPDEAQALFDFFEARSGSLESFLWTPPFLGYGEEAYGFVSAISWSRIGMDEYNASVRVERRPLETP